MRGEVMNIGNNQKAKGRSSAYNKGSDVTHSVCVFMREKESMSKC